MSNPFARVCAACLFLGLLGACAPPRMMTGPAASCPTPVIILPPFAIAELSHHDAQYFEGMPYLFSKGYYRAARSLLQSRSSIPNLPGAVRDRLIFAWALADQHLGPAEMKEGQDLLRDLDSTKTPYELKEASRLLRQNRKEELRLNRERNLLREKLTQVKKTLQEFSNLEKSLK